MANLAIKGHPTRSEEVIKLLKMLGGKNKIFSDETILFRVKDPFYFTLEKDNSISVCYIRNFKKEEQHITFTLNGEQHITFTLEQFLEKYPYKVGDKINIGNKPHQVLKMEWCSSNNEVHYTIEHYQGAHTVEFLQPYTEQKEEIMETITIDNLKAHTKEWLIDKLMSMSQDNALQTICNLHDELHKPQYPIAFEECCNVLGVHQLNYLTYTWNREDKDCDVNKHEEKLLFLLDDFRKLLICRDAYWKIAEDWKPDWKDCIKAKYTIHLHCDGHIFWQDVSHTEYRWLSFPTEEMRDAFYKNFKELIEKCKELL